jgi:hypothetical protein
MKNISILLALLLTLASTWWVTAEDAKNVAVVQMLRGNVSVIYGKASSPVKQGEWIKEGGVIKTAEKSIAKLVFIDKSSINVAPNSEMKVEKFSKTEAGLLDVVKGKIRAEVSKDYLEMNEGQKSKLFVKSPSAVMGVRGTEFVFSHNHLNNTSSAVLIEGQVAFSKLGAGERPSYNQLDRVVERDNIQIRAGEFSVASPSSKAATIPAVLNVKQMESIKSNSEFKSSSDPTQAKSEESKEKRSVVPPGLSGKVVASENAELKKVGESAANENGRSIASEKANEQAVDKANSNSAISKAEGFVTSDGKVKPANGSFLDIATGVVVAPPDDSQYDPGTNTFIPSEKAGDVAVSGEYIPPKNVEIKADGQVVRTEVVGGVEQKIVMNPNGGVVPVNAFANANMQRGPAPIGAPTGYVPPPPKGTVSQNDVLNGQFNQNGFQDISINNNTSTGLNNTVMPTRAKVGFTFNIQ